MSSLSNILNTLGPSASGVLALSVAVSTGLAIGRIQVRGVRLGVSGVLFTSLALAQAGVSFVPEALPFVRDFSLVLFVYAIGLQVGPGFLASFRADGLRLNVLGAAALLLAAGLALVVAHMPGLPRDSAPGVFAGGLTSTPALAGGQVVIRQLMAADQARQNAALGATSLAYAVTYPFGVVGPVFVIVLLRRVFGVRMEEERGMIAARAEATRRARMSADFEVVDSVYVGRSVGELPAFVRRGVIFSRLYRAGELSVPSAATVFRPGDVVRAFGPPEDVREVVKLLGKPSKLDLASVGGGFRRADLVVTKAGVLRRTLRELDLRGRIGVVVVQVNRSGVELDPNGGLALKFGDQVAVVGPESAIQMAIREFGNEPEALNRSSLLPVFLGLALGVLVGAIPLSVPGLPVPLQIGLAGGPFLVAIALSQLGSLGPVVWYMPAAANQIVRDLGLSVFLACIGFQSGSGLLERAAQGGVGLLVAGALVTLMPVFVVACFARKVLRMNFVTLSGWVAGAMTSSPALVFASEEAGSDVPALAYASVAPLCTILPILCAEMLALAMR